MCMNNRDQVLVEELKTEKKKTLKIFYEEYFALFVSFCQQPTSLGRGMQRRGS